MKFPYFKLKNAFSDARHTFATGDTSDKLASTAKLLGKTVANVGMLAADASVELAKRAPEIVGTMAQQTLAKHSQHMSSEQIESANNAVRLGKEARDRRLAKELEQESQKDKTA